MNLFCLLIELIHYFIKFINSLNVSHKILSTFSRKYLLEMDRELTFYDTKQASRTSDSSVNQDKEVYVEVIKSTEKKVKAAKEC